MADLTRERRNALRTESALYHADIDVDSGDLSLTHAELRALLDAADERDRLREALKRLLQKFEDDELQARADGARDDWWEKEHGR